MKHIINLTKINKQQLRRYLKEKIIEYNFNHDLFMTTDPFVGKYIKWSDILKITRL